MKSIIVLIILTMSLLYTNAQNEFKALNTGDQLPPIHLRNILNYKGGTSALAALQKDKFLLIDFWGTYCAPCIKFLPVLDSLQLEFGNELQIISVTMQDVKTIKSFLATKKIDTGHIYYIAEDTVLMHYFPYRLIPHFVWIDPDGKVIGTTDEREVTRENIRRTLNRENVIMSQKNDDMKFDYTKPYDPQVSLIKYRSLLTGYNSGLSGGMLIDPLLIKPDIHYADSLKRIFLWNDDIASLYYTAFTKYVCPYPNFNRIIIEAADSSRFKSPKYRAKNRKDWEVANLYSYELIIDTLTDSKTFFEYMWNDLNRFFSVKASVEKRDISCWVITDSLKNRELLQTGGGKETIEWQVGGVLHKLQNKTMDELVLYLNSFPNSLPVTDETGITGRVDLIVDLATDSYVLDIDNLRQALNHYGLALTKTTRNLDVVVIRDK